MNNIIAIDTEYFQQIQNKLHRPGGIFACLSTSEGTTIKEHLKTGKQETQSYLSTLKKRQNSSMISMHHALYDVRQLKASGLWPAQWEPNLWDTMLVEQGLFGGLYQLNSLADLSRRWLGIYLNKDIVSQFGTSTTLTRSMRRYASDDAITTMAIAIAQQKYVQDQFDGEFDWYWNIDLPAMWAVLNMPPVRMDVDGWLAHGEALYAEGIRIQTQLEFNVKSVPQVKSALRKVGIRPGKSTGAPEMEKWLNKAQYSQNQKQIDLLTAIMRARKCRDAMSKYGTEWIDKNVENKEWIYPNWNVVGAETGRMSCSKPNMQNIPKKGEGSIYRSFFLATKGGRLLVGDIAQQEPRFSAFLSHDPNLTKEIINGINLHQRAADLFKITGSKSEKYAKGKTINLGLNYGMSAYGLASRLGITIDEAKKGVRARRRHYNRYYAWQDRQIRHAERTGFVNTVTGRPIWTNEYDFGYKRNAINAPIQGSAADQTKLALSYVREQCTAENIPFQAILVVHDEIVIDVPRGMMKTYKRIMKDAWMEAGKKLMPTMPTVVNMATGYNWKVE